MDIAESQTAYLSFLHERPCERRSRRRFKILKNDFRIGAVVSLSILIFVACSGIFFGWQRFGNRDSRLLTKLVNIRANKEVDISSWSEDEFESEFQIFLTQHNKVYDDDEHLSRRAIFTQNLMHIRNYNLGNSSYKLAVNKFADMTDEEFRSVYASTIRQSEPRRNIAWELLSINESQLPNSIDWREKGCVTEVKDQHSCGSCWAFSATGASEGAICARTGFLPDLSEQQLIDCAGPEGNKGCNGGEPDWAFNYIMNTGGLCSEEDYPYNGNQSAMCSSAACEPVALIREFQDIPAKNELAVRAVLALYGPVSVSLQADQTNFRFYHSGVFNADCGVLLDHATLLVGYGTDEETGMDYFVMKNSWGGSWGEDGYMRIARNKYQQFAEAGECGILLAPTFARA